MHEPDGQRCEMLHTSDGLLNISMRYVDLLREALTFRTEMRGHHSGQSDQTLVAYDDGEYVGHIDYGVWNGEPAVQMISVPEKRRRGYATALVQRLQAEFPDIEIDMGSLTDEGSKLLAAIPHEVIPNPDYQAKAQRLEQVKAELAKLAQMADAYHANPTEQARQVITDLHDHWNDLHSEDWSWRMRCVI